MRKILALGMSVLLLAGTMAGCGQPNVKKETVKLGYMNWDDSIAITNLAAVVLEDEMGYEVEITMADVAPVFTSIASGSIDAYLDAWLPNTQKGYMAKYGDKLVDLGVLCEGVSIGLVVPSYVPANSIEELNDYKEMLGGEIVGIDAGAEMMEITENLIKEYGLDFTLLTSSGPAMTTALKKAIDAQQPIVVTGWKPHWKFSRWDLKMLEDPKGLYGEQENIHKLSRLGFDEDMPEVARFLRNFTLTQDELSGLMSEIETAGVDPTVTARNWAKDHEELVKSWIPE